MSRMSGSGAQRAATSRDVARLAGVAQSTVSYVLSGKGAISTATRERVLRAAEELNYRPNQAARAMRGGRGRRVAVVVPSLLHNPGDILVGVTAAAEEHGFALEIHSVFGDREQRGRRLQQISDSGHFSGVLVLDDLAGGDAVVRGDAVIVRLAEFDDQGHASGELADAAPITHIIEALASAGHRRFLHISGIPTYPSALARQRGYLETVERLGLESLGVVAGDWSGASGEAAVDALPPTVPPLAVIAANDLTAAGAIRAAHRRGWVVGEQVLVTGWDNLAMGKSLWPSLTTVHVDYELLGRRAMSRLLAALGVDAARDDDTPLQRVVWRESTGMGVAESDVSRYPVSPP